MEKYWKHSPEEDFKLHIQSIRQDNLDESGVHKNFSQLISPHLGRYIYEIYEVLYSNRQEKGSFSDMTILSSSGMTSQVLTLLLQRLPLSEEGFSLLLKHPLLKREHFFDVLTNPTVQHSPERIELLLAHPMMTTYALIHFLEETDACEEVLCHILRSPYGMTPGVFHTIVALCDISVHTFTHIENHPLFQHKMHQNSFFANPSVDQEAKELFQRKFKKYI